MIVLINPNEGLADLLIDATQEHVQDIPMDHLMSPCGGAAAEDEAAIVVELVPSLGGGGEDPFDPGVEPSSKAAQYEPGKSFGQETDIGNVIEVMVPFRPILYGGQIALPEGRLFEVTGYSPGTDQRADQMGHIDVPNPLYPEEGDNPAQFLRLKIQDEETGVEVVILPLEFERFMSARGTFPRKPSKHRSRTPTPKPTSEEEAEDDRSDTQLTPTVITEAPTQREVTRRERIPS